MDIIGCRFQEVIDQQKKHMRRVSNVYRERVRGIKTVLFFIGSLLSGETVPTKWRPCQDKIMTTPAATVENQEKTIQNKLKVLQLTNENTNKIAGSNLLNSDSKTSQAYGEQSSGMPRSKSDCART